MVWIWFSLFCIASYVAYNYSSKLEIKENEFRELEYRFIEENDAQGLYEPVFAHDDLESYKSAIKECRRQQKEMISAKTAVTIQWSNQRNIDAQLKREAKLMLRSFNGETSSLISNLTYRNYNTSVKRFHKCFDLINKHSFTKECQISQEYLLLRQLELELSFAQKEMKEFEKEKQKEERIRLKEEKLAEKEQQKEVEQLVAKQKTQENELEKVKLELETQFEREKTELLQRLATQKEQELENLSQNKEEQEQTLKLLKTELEEQHLDEKNKFLDKIAELEQALNETQRKISQAQITRLGHVYIISNIGAFGEGVYKIGLTRRLDPRDRILELSGAAVPFRYDIHGMIFTEDAPALESKLHTYFDDKRVNKVNKRKEFFRVSLDEIEQAINEIEGTKIELVRSVGAKEYYQTLQLTERQTV